MKRSLRVAALALLLLFALTLMPGTQPVCEGSWCYEYYSYMEGPCLVTEVHNTCFNCVDYWWECPWGDWEDSTCY